MGKQLEIVEVQGSTYLGTVSKKGVLKGVGFTDNNVPLAKYIERRELGRLTKLRIGDMKNTLSTDLSPEDQLELARLEGLWQIADLQAYPQLVAENFRKVAGKK